MPDVKPDQAPETPAEPQAPAPQYVTREELASQAESLVQRIQGIVAAAQLQPQAPAPVAPAAPRVSLSDINDAVAKGEGAAERIDALIEQRVAERLGEVQRTQIDPIRTVGLSNLAQVAKATALNGLNPKYVKRFEKQIDGFMANMGDDVKGNVDAWKRAYNLVLGENFDVLERESREEAARTAAARPVEQTPSSSGKLLDEDGTELPSIEALAGPDGSKVLRDKGIRDLDDLARRMGYPDAKAYLKVAKEIDAFQGDLI